MGMKRVILVLVLALVLPALGSAQIVNDLKPEDPIVERASGEIQVLKEVVSADGFPYRVSLAFADRGSYEEALALRIGEVSLGRLDVVWLRGDGGKIETYSVDDGTSLKDLDSLANGNLCGDVFARGTVKLASGLTMGVSLHAGGVRDASTGVVTLAVAHKKFRDDIYGDCDFFAAGGCGGPTCYNHGIDTTGQAWSYKGDCRELEIWGPNTCYCHTTSAVPVH